MFAQRLSILFGVLTLAGCRTVTDPDSASRTPDLDTRAITGAVTYRERLALPDDAVVEVALFDTTEDFDVRIGSQVIEDPSAVPVRFEIPFDPTVIQPDRTYAVEAEITVAGRVMFRAERAKPVLTKGYPSHVTLTLELVTPASLETPY